jgi:hypothetical protein
MEPTGIEPVTSCLQSTRSRAVFRPEKPPPAGHSAWLDDVHISVDARGSSASIADSGTFGGECLNENVVVVLFDSGDSVDRVHRFGRLDGPEGLGG